jgi:uncharacterized membrane protein YjfL (UPF0719 family)
MSTEKTLSYSDKMILLFRTLLAFSYIILGFFAYWNRGLVTEYPTWAVMAFVVLIVAYGIFRIYRAYTFYQECMENE